MTQGDYIACIGSHRTLLDKINISSCDSLTMLESMGRFVILWIFSVLLTVHPVSSLGQQLDDVGDICREILSCKCYVTQLPKSNASILAAHCDNPRTQDLQRLLEHNIEKLTLNQGTQNDTVRALQLLQNKSTSIKRMSLRKTQLTTLNMSLLPENTERLSLVDNIALDEITSSDHEHDTKRLRLFQSLYIQIDGRKAPDLKYLPESSKYITISGASSIAKFKWPKYLQYFKSSIMIEGYPTEALAEVGPNLRSFHVSFANIRNGFMPKIIGSPNITHIMIQYCNVSFVDKDTFLHNRLLVKLDLAGNSLTRFDATMPATLRHLMLQNNRIEIFNFNSTAKSHLIYLGLHKNSLTECPMRLPKTLETLVLNHNNIEICSPKALKRLTELKQLDLANNRLKITPSGIHSKLEIYRINANLLSRMHGPENYEFCSECKYVEIGGNDWFCDIHFLKFLLWIIKRMSVPQRKVNIFHYYGRCKNLAEYVFTQWYLEEVANYIRYIKSHDACMYEPQQLLNCTKANLTVFPNAPPRGLKSVIISGNSKLTKTPDFLFANQRNLREITLSINNLKRIPFGLPSCVEWLDLQGNNITELSPKDILAFNNLTKLENLILHDNHIKTVLSQDFSALKSLTWLGLEGNDLVCDCSLHSFILWFEQLNKQYQWDNHLIRFARCNNPPNVKHRDVRKLYYHYEYELQCVSPLCEFDEKSMELNCSIHSQISGDRMKLHALSGPIYGQFPKILAKDYWRKMFMDGLKLKDEDVNITEFINLIHVDLSNNLLKQWSPKRLPRSLQKLLLRGNLINGLPEIGTVLKYQPNLEIVDLRDNKIKTVMPKQTTTLMSLRELYMNGNPFECSCSLGTFKLWLKMNATAVNHTSDAEILRCTGPPDLAGQKLVNLKEDDICKTTTSVDIRIWVSAGLLIGVLLLSMIVTIQVIKRRRYRQQILQGFQRLLQQDACYNHAFVENEMSISKNSKMNSYIFDAFIATEECDDDRQFVEELITELEGKRQLRLCISTRDFMPGIDISDNIIDGITSSKRVVLLISKTFVASPWCQYKVQVALTELHMRKKAFLIPIILEDLNVDTTITTLLSLIPISKAPRQNSSRRNWDKFWIALFDLINN